MLQREESVRVKAATFAASEEVVHVKLAKLVCGFHVSLQAGSSTMSSAQSGDISSYQLSGE